VHKLVHRYKVALPLLGENGTQPNVYYIPPMESPPKYDAFGKIIEDSQRVPIAELERLFGTDVGRVVNLLKEEREKQKSGEKSEILELLIAYQHSDMFRLDSDYYRQVAKERGKKPYRELDDRYRQGKYTQKSKLDGDER